MIAWRRRAFAPALFLGLTASAAAQGAGQGGDFRLLEEQLTAYPFSQTCAMTSTPDGSRLFASEGCSVAFIEADPSLPAAQQNYRTPTKRVGVGKRGVLPVKLLYDPGPELLYIAGGRDGLWVMDANFGATAPNPAWRVDDKGNQLNILYQRSRKWCDDLAYVTLGQGAQRQVYLAALFAKRDESHLCFYPLSAVRGLAAQGWPEETGHELAPQGFAKLLPNPTPPSAAANYSFAFAMAVEEHYDAASDTSTADIYVAMGQHGLLRVHVAKMPGLSYSFDWGPCFGDGSLYAQNEPAGGAMLYGDVHFIKSSSAPRFAGRLIAQHAPYFLDVAVDTRREPHHRLYAAADNVGLVSFDLEETWQAYMPTGFHQEGIQTAVGADLGKACARLVADPPGSTNYPFSFARSVEITSTVVGTQPSAALVVSSHSTMFTRNPGDLNHGRSFDYLARSLGGIPADLTGPAPFGTVFWGRGVDDNYTMVYDLGPTSGPGIDVTWTSGQINALAFTRMGAGLHVFENQVPDSLSYYVCGQADADKIPSSAVDEEYVLGRVDYLPGGTFGWPATQITGGTGTTPYQDRLTLREVKYRPGRWTYALAPNPSQPNLLDTGSNDGKLRPEGAMTLDLRDASGPKIAAYFAPDVSTYTDDAALNEDSNDGSFGILFNPEGALEKNGFLYRLSMGGGGGSPRWRFTKYEVGNDPYNTGGGATTPEALKRILLLAPPDKFNSRGTYNYASGASFAVYNTQLTQNPPQGWEHENVVFVTYNASPSGCWVLDFDKLITFIDTESGSQGTTDGEILDLDLGPWDTAVIGELTTHPEFWNVPDDRDGGVVSTTDFLDANSDEYGKISGGVRTMYPDLFQMPDPDQAGEVRQVLAVPSGTAYCDETLGLFGTYSSWQPEAPFRSSAGLHHMLVRFFDVTDPTKITTKAAAPSGFPASSNLPAWTIIGPCSVDGNDVLDTSGLSYQTPGGTQSGTDHSGGDFRPKGSNANDIDVVEVPDGANSRFFCFTADLGGSLQVFEITGLLSTPPDFASSLPGYLQYGGTLSIANPIGSSPTEDAISDGNPAGAWSVVVDQVSFVDANAVQQDHVIAYVSAARNGLEVYQFDMNAPSPLRRIDIIQTPGEGGMLYLWEEGPGNPVIDDHWNGFIKPPLGGTGGKKLLFFGDTRAGLRILGYE